MGYNVELRDKAKGVLHEANAGLHIYENFPLTMSFDELIEHPAYRNYGDNGLKGEYFRWWVLLQDGTYYRGGPDETGHKCNPLEKLDPVMFHH